MPRPAALLLLSLAIPGGGAEVGVGDGVVLPGKRAGGEVGAEAGGKRQLQLMFRLWGLLEVEEVWEYLLSSVLQAPVWDPQ